MFANKIDQVTYLMQVRKLRKLAFDIVSNYPIKISAINLITYGANAIFKVTDNRNKKYVLRILSSNYHTKEAVLEELKWLEFILKKIDIRVPKAIQNKTGNYIVKTDDHEPRYCNMFQWIEGKRLWKGIDKNYAYHLGKIMGQLQKNGRGLKIRHRIYWDTEGLVGTKRPRYWNLDNLSSISIKQQDIIKHARQCAYEQLIKYEKFYPEKSGLIHGDLQPNNILVQKSEYAVIDFDDCGIGLFGYDIANALHAFQNLIKGSPEKNYHILEHALIEGYREDMPFDQRDVDILPCFILAQKLNGVAALELRKDTPKLRSYFPIAVEDAINFFKTIK